MQMNQGGQRFSRQRQQAQQHPAERTDKRTDKHAAKHAEKRADDRALKRAQKQAEKRAEKHAEKHAEKRAEKDAEKRADKRALRGGAVLRRSPAPGVRPVLGRVAAFALLCGLLLPAGLVQGTTAFALPAGETTAVDPAAPEQSGSAEQPENTVQPEGAEQAANAEQSDTGNKPEQSESGQPATEAPDDPAAQIPDGTAVETPNAPGTHEPTPGPVDGGATEPTQGGATGPGAVAPRTVPTAPAGSAVISVRVGGDRLANGTVGGLAGVKLGLYEAGTATTGGGTSAWPVQGTPGQRVNAAWSWTTCVSDADGDCNFVIPIRAGNPSNTGAAQDTRFWVVQEGTPAGWYSNPVLRVGSFAGTPEGTWQYRFRTDTQLRAGTTYRSTTAMPWDEASPTGAASAGNPDRFFMRNRIDTNAEGSWASNVTRTTGVWNQSRNNPDLIGECGIDIALIADTSGSLGASGIAALKSAMTSFVGAFQGTNTRMALFSFSDVSPGNGGGLTNYPTLLPVTTTAQATLFEAQYGLWTSGGGTNWDRGFSAAANSVPQYDLAILLTDGNPSVQRDNPDNKSSAFNSLQDIDSGVFSANQLKAKGTRIVALGVGEQLTAASEYNLRAVSGPTKGSDYFRAADFTAATQALVGLANEHCSGTIGVQKMIVPAGGTIADATPAPAGWQFTASGTTAAATVQAPATRTTVTGGDGKVAFDVSFTAPASSGPVQLLETQQSGYELLPVGSGATARNASCVNTATGAAVPVTNAGTAAQPGVTVQATRAQHVECKIYNRVIPPGKLEIEKRSDPATGAAVRPGQSVTYTLTFRNVGGQPIAVNHDDVLSDVLDDAALTGAISAQSPLAAALNPAGDRLRVTGTLPAGAERTVSYTVTVRDPIPNSANGVLRNVVVPTGEQPPTTCAPGTPCTEHPVRAGLSWNKVDETGELLAGSEWTLTPLNANGQPQTGSAVTIVDCVAASAAACAGPDRDPAAGKFSLTGLAIAKYQLRETRAPAGFQLLTDPIQVNLNTNVSLGNVENTQIEVPPIPLTGGMGSLSFALAAGGLGAAAVGGLWWQRRRAGDRRRG